MTSEENLQLGVLDRLTGYSDAIAQVRLLVRRIAGTKISVLMQGESGTGKEVVARMIHDFSPRRDAAFVPVNCGAIPEGLFESEVFGHERGSFTGAEKQHKGYFERAHGGTIFLDEVGDMPLQMQVKVLRALESGEYFRVGGTKPMHADVRVISATNRDLTKAVAERKFREDLYFRLKAVEIQLPPLRERPEDIPPLVERFANEFAVENKISRPRLLRDGMEALKNHEWKGNVRELKHFIGTLLTLEYEGPIDGEAVRRHLPQAGALDRTSYNLPAVLRRDRTEVEGDLLLQLILDLRRDVKEIKEMLIRVLMMNRYPDALPEAATYMEDSDITDRPTLEEIEREQIRQVLHETEGNRRAAAKILGISERTLYRKINEYNL
ncbi:sigma-54 dependent transcriptional regulator [bacterium]|nr:sigma-54 dependent transcriptional regulator [bacterium]